MLDACAQRQDGHILERTPGIAEHQALDCDAARLARVQQNLTRLGLVAQLKTADLLMPGWWDGRPFDRILLDAPCSGTGVIRRHPDIKLLRRQEDIRGFAATQLDMLLRCAAMLTAGGLWSMPRVHIAGGKPRGGRGLPQGAAAVQARRRGPPRAARPRGEGAATTDGFYYARLRMGKNMSWLPRFAALLLPLLVAGQVHASASSRCSPPSSPRATAHMSSMRASCFP